MPEPTAPGTTGSTESAQPQVTTGPAGGTPIVASSPQPSLPSATPGSAGPLPLVGTDQGFTGGAGGTDSVAYGLVLTNPNLDLAAHRMPVMVDFFDQAGDFLAGDEVFVTLLPTQTTAIAGNVFGAGAAVRMELGVPDDPTAFVAPATAGRFEITGSTYFDDGLVITTGELTSRFGSDQPSVGVTVIYRDSAGAIVGGANGGIELVEAGERAAFDIVDGTSYPEITSTELYWQLSGALE